MSKVWKNYAARDDALIRRVNEAHQRAQQTTWTARYVFREDGEDEGLASSLIGTLNRASP